LPLAYFQLLMVLVFAVAAWEWADLSGFSAAVQRWAYASVLALLVVVLSDAAGITHFIHLSFMPSIAMRDIAGLGGAWWALALLWVMSYPASSSLWGATPTRLLMGIVVIVPAAVALLYVLGQAQGQWLFLYMVGIVATADIGAYFAGRKFGKAKLAPKVSPGKSWAGFYGGVVAVAVYATVIALTTSLPSLPVISWVVITVMASLASVLGDLVESMVKRHRGAKDSSQLLPGHGGFMDRVDSMTAAAPVFVLLLVLLQSRVVVG
ncbi:MAG: phosphatidate cytidylyltransferase, partial [Pseudomonadales bacterium]|nr:phosphatidate cytidylyltransferase [Pseudomonadales bacterium]